MPVVSGIIRSRERAIMALGCENFAGIEQKLSAAIAKPIPPSGERLADREVTLVGDDVDLFRLPIPMSSIYDGGPMITAGVVIARDPELGFNSGIYRFIVKEKALTGIDLVTPQQHAAVRAAARSPATSRWPISISIGTHRSRSPVRLSRAARRRRDGDRRRHPGRAGGAGAVFNNRYAVYRRRRDRARGRSAADRLDFSRRPLRRIHPADGRAYIGTAGAHQGDRHAPKTRSTTICTCRGRTRGSPRRRATRRSARRCARPASR